MDSIINFNSLLSFNLVILGCVFICLVMKGEQKGGVTYLTASLTPLIALQLDWDQFGTWPSSAASAGLIARSSDDAYPDKPISSDSRRPSAGKPSGSSVVVIALVDSGAASRATRSFFAITTAIEKRR